jgi:tape measure domain-containing protein
MTVNQTGFRVDANINPFEQAMRRMVTAARDGQSGVGSAMGGLRQVTEGLRGAVMQLGAAYVGLQGAVNFVRTADEVTLLNARLKLVTGSIEAAGEAQKELLKVAQSLQVPYTELAGTFARIMPAVTALGGGVREATALSEILVSTARLSGASAAEAAASAMQFAQALGSGVLQGDELRSILENNQALARTLASALGLSIGELRKWGSEGKLTADLVANALLGQIDNIRKETKDLPVTVGGAWTKVKNAFVSMAEEFEKGTGAVNGLAKTLDGVVPVIGRLTQQFAASQKIFGGFWAGLYGMGTMSSFKTTSENVNSLQKEVLGLEAALEKHQKRDKSIFISGIEKDLAMARKRLAFAKEIQALEQKAIDDKDGKGTPPMTKLGGAAAGSKGAGKPADKEKAAKELSQIPLYEAELAKKIETFEKAAQAEGTLRQFSRAEEAAYWKEVSTRAELSAEDKARAEKRWRDLERTLRNDAFTVEMTELEQRKQAAQNNLAQRIALAQQAHDKTVAMFGAESKEAAAAYAKVLDEKRRQVQQTLQLDDLMAQRRRDKALADVELDRMDAQHKVAMGQMTQQQLLVQQQQFEERMHAIRLQYLQQAQAAVDPERDPIRKAQIDAQIEQLELQHRQRLKGIKDQLTAQQAGPERNMFDGMQNAFSSAATDMLTRAQTLRQGLTSIYGSISSVFLQEIVSKPLAMLAARAIRESALYKMMANMAIMNQLKASGGVVAAKGGETMAVGGMNAAQAGSGTFAALAAIPVIGPALAAAAGPLMFATVMAMVSRGMGGGGSTTTTTTRIPSASGGFDIPRGLNPLTQLHEQEMVLPAHIANPLRDSLAQGGGAGQGGDAAPVVIHTTGGDFVHKRDLAKLLTTMRRDYRFQT